LRQRSRLIVGVEAAGIGKDPSVAIAEEFLLETNAGAVVARDDAVRTDADEGDNPRPPSLDFGFEPLAAGAKFLVGEFVGARRWAAYDIRNAIAKLEKKIAFER
jgi:hypothetical protein